MTCILYALRITMMASILIILRSYPYLIEFVSNPLKAKKNDNECFDKLHIILLIHVYALSQILQVK